MDTDMRADKHGFQPTHWSRVNIAADPHTEAGSSALEAFVLAYRQPITAFVRSISPGLPDADIEDRVSDFITEKIITGDFLAKARKERGRLRNLLKEALRKHATDKWRHDHRQKRLPGGGFVPIDAVAEPSTSEVNGHGKAFDEAWARQILDKARQSTEAYYCKVDKRKWDIFLEFVYNPAFSGSKPPPRAEVAKRHGLKKEQDVSNALLTVKRLFGHHIKDAARKLAGPEDLEAEIDELIAIFSETD